MSHDVWEALQRAAGRPVQVTLPASTEKRRPKRSKGGRPRIRGPVRFGHYEGYDPDRGGRPRCAMPGCGKYLRMGQTVACSEAHAKHVVDEAQKLLRRANAGQ